MRKTNFINRMTRYVGLLSVASAFVLGAGLAPAQDEAAPAEEAVAAEEPAVPEEPVAEEEGPTAEEIAAAEAIWNPFVAAVKAAEGEYEFEGDEAEADALFGAAETLIAAEKELDVDADATFVTAVYPSTSKYGTFLVNNLWLLISAALVFLMHLGFATLEAGLTQKKNAVNILFKNVFIIAAGLLTYFIFGFNTHYPGEFNGYFAAGGPASIAPGTMIANQTELYAGYTWWTDFIFQAMFAATAATIVSGAVAERVKLPSFLIFAVLLVGIAYPVVGSWHWGGGFLSDWGFYDFAGSTVVHAFGGFAALACVIVLKARTGKYSKSGIKPILGHNMPLATIGVFLLWLGWYGFNGGSVLNADANGVSFVFVTTSLAAASGAMGAIVTAWVALKKPDLSMGLNGILAGLVGITAGADSISPMGSILVGAIAGVIVVFAIVILDRARIDDPVGAISVHGICGLWGTWAVGIFGGKDLAVQVGGSLVVAGVAFGFSFVVFTILKVVMGIRVDVETEVNGLDVDEHGVPAYGEA